MPKRIMVEKVYATRRRGEPRAKGMDQAVEDMNRMGVRGFWASVKRRTASRHMVEEVKTYPRL